MDKFKEVVPKFIWDYTPVVVLAVGGYYTIHKIGSAIVQKYNKKRMLVKWQNSPKDVVIVHALPCGRTVPSNSPFVVKLETYLRMANITYQLDNEYPFGAKEKTPWITLNGEHIDDSQLIIEFLAKKFPKQVGGIYSEEQKAIGTMARILIDEHAYWGLLHWRYVHTEGRDLDKIFNMPDFAIKMFRKMALAKVRNSIWLHGIGRHTPEQIFKIMQDDLEALSKTIGKNKYLLGDEPSVDDCAVFGGLVELLWAAPGSPYEKLINEEYPNLKEYCVRMKETFWPDWENCIAPAKME